VIREQSPSAARTSPGRSGATLPPARPAGHYVAGPEHVDHRQERVVESTERYVVVADCVTDREPV
jgi:hypothetical protein